MAAKRNTKKKQKDAKRKKQRSRGKAKALRIEKADEYAWQADTCCQQKRYAEAYDLAMHGLWVHEKHLDCFHFAWLAGNAIEPDRQPLLKALLHGWNHGLIENRQHLLVLGNLVYNNKDWGLAQKIFEAFIENPDNLFQAENLERELKDAEYYLGVCKDAQNIERAQKKLETKATLKKERTSPTTSTPKKENAPAKTTSHDIPPETSVKENLPALDIFFDSGQDDLLQVIGQQHVSEPALLDLMLSAYKLSFRTSYDQLICLPTLHEVESLWYQEETARKVMKTLRGRAVLADEVGLGKTIEASLVLKEYILRGLVRTALVLVPSSLVDQWQKELKVKFGLEFVSSNDAMFRQSPDTFWQQPFLLVSLQTARMKRYWGTVTSRTYDMVIVDEAHHLKNRVTQNWKLVNALQETFLLLLTATPVQNKLEELYNLVTLLKPGHLSTRKAFMAEFVARGNPTDPRNREKLRELLKEVMVRNTRSVAHLRLPPRFASTIQVEPTQEEADFYRQMSDFVAAQAGKNGRGGGKMALRRLLEAAGSSHVAALRMLENMSGRPAGKAALLRSGKQIDTSSKAKRVLDLLKSTRDQAIVFVNYRHSLDYLLHLFQTQHIPHVVYRGGMTPAQKQEAMNRFQRGVQVLLATDTGGEGHNLQFCHTMINYDLP